MQSQSTMRGSNGEYHGKNGTFGQNYQAMEQNMVCGEYDFGNLDPNNQAINIIHEESCNESESQIQYRSSENAPREYYNPHEIGFY